MPGDNPSISEAARLFGQSLPPGRHFDSQEALRFARWFGESRRAGDLRPADIEAYVSSFGATAPNAQARVGALKGFLDFAHRQGILTERLVSHVRLRRPGTKTRAPAPSHTAPREVRMTAAGKAALVAELAALRQRRSELAAEIRHARSDGDVRENAPLEAAREAAGLVDSRIHELEAMLRHAVVTDGEAAAAEGARVGSTIVIANLATGAKLSYQLVNAAEARPGSGRLSIESPVGQAVLGRHVGDEVEVAAPSGVLRFRIESIEG